METYDLTPITGRRCLLRLVGRRCMAGAGPGGDNTPCDGCAWPLRVLDHVSMWKHSDDSLVMVSQPYAADIQEAKRVAEAHGLALLVSDELSWHLPGATTLLMFGRQEVVYPDGRRGD